MFLVLKAHFITRPIIIAKKKTQIIYTLVIQLKRTLRKFLIQLLKEGFVQGRLRYRDQAVFPIS